MHHSEIGKIVDVFESLHVLSTDPYPIKIEAYLRGYGNTDSMGVRLRTDLVKGYITVAIDNSQKDSNGITLSYFENKSDTDPDEARVFVWLHQDFSITAIRNFIKKLTLIDRGKLSIDTLDDREELDDKYRITQLDFDE
jgi:hypothetical protein